MMDLFDNELNNVLVETFKSILKVEEIALKNTGMKNLSISEMHLLEAIGKNKDEGRTISEIAQELNITLPSVTIAINKLVNKEYAQKIKRGGDARMVYVTLTKIGKKIDSAHRYFHEQMIRKVGKDLSKEEKTVLLKGIKGLNEFFKKAADKNK